VITSAIRRGADAPGVWAYGIGFFIAVFFEEYTFLEDERVSMRETVLVSAVRTPLGKFNGMLSSIGATDLGGIGTAGNSSSISDGAAAVIVMSRDKAIKLGCKVQAMIGAQASYGIDPKYLLAAPIWAIPKCLAKEGLALSQVDLFEVNEAFAGSTCAVMQELELDPAKTNVNGGSIALGHPIGASGCRILVTLLYEMARRRKHVGVASLCLGGGEAVALIVRR
jgi:acetyl-CoA C-acetyltransferase